MEIILKKDIANLGYENDLVSVKPGYGRNYLIPKGWAVVATESNKKIRDEVIRQKAFKEEKLRNDATVKAEALEGITVKIAAKAGASGKIFGSVNSVQISDAIKEQHNYDVDRKKIMVDTSNIKEIGKYEAKIKLYKEIEATIHLDVFEEE